jgi:acetyl esterase/lipase
MRPMAAALSKIGIATWNVEYRRVGNAGGGWPGTFQDLARATDSLRELAPKYRLDLRRVVVAGHSSGAHLAMWIAARRKLPASSPLHVADPLAVKAIMSIDGPIDPVAFQAVETEVCPNRAMTQFLGGTPAQRPERYRDASPMTFLPLGVPQELIAGGVMTMFRSQLTDYQTAARAKGDSVTVTPLDGAGHFDMLLPGSKYWAIVEDRLLALLRASD